MIEHVTRVRGAKGAGEDRVSVVPRGQGLVIALADGAGGTGRGARAADLAVARLAAAAQLRELDATAALKDVNRQLAVLGGEAAAIVLAVTASRIKGASVGDCAAWIVAPDGNVDMLTARQHRKPLLGGGASTISFTAPFSRPARSSSARTACSPTPRPAGSSPPARTPRLDEVADALVHAVELPDWRPAGRRGNRGLPPVLSCRAPSRSRSCRGGTILEPWASRRSRKYAR